MEKIMTFLGFLIIGLSVFSGDNIITPLGIYLGMSLILLEIFWDDFN